ncbi:28439_t:CDS:2, partial [Dentiscutata erythropus]
EDLYFGPFCHNWWISRLSEKNNDFCFLFPIHLHSKILIVLNEYDFIIEVGQLNSQFGPHPSYIYKCNEVQSELCETPSTAITTNISMNFHFESLIILLISYEYGYLELTNQIIKSFESNECKITIYTENNIQTFIDDDLESVWSQISCLKQFTDYQLFGLDHQYVQKLIREIQIPTCTLSNWNNDDLMTSIYKYHLKRHTCAQISYAINRHICLGFDISVGQDIENAIKGIRETSVANLKPNRDRDLNLACLNRQNLEKEPMLRGMKTNEKENRNILVSDLKIQQEKNQDTRLGSNSAIDCEMKLSVLVEMNNNNDSKPGSSANTAMKVQVEKNQIKIQWFALSLTLDGPISLRNLG